jgi:hypothetical protein
MKKYLEKKQPEQKAQSPCLAIHDSARSSQGNRAFLCQRINLCCSVPNFRLLCTLLYRFLCLIFFIFRVY